MAYSGGVDSTFTVLRHSRKQAGRAGCDLVSAVFVHGFDIPLAQREGFDLARGRAAEATASCGVPLTVVETNFREFVEPWTYVFGSALAATLFQFSGLAKVGLIAADVDYGMVNLPWGSNLVTNPLLSSSRFEIVTDGAGATRSDKVAAIAQIPALRDRLRVCWEGADKSKNCGECEKCRRTYLNFLATGSEPGEFLKGIDRSRLAQIKPRNAWQRNFIRDIIKTAQTNGIRAPWVKELRRALQPRSKRKGFAPRVKGALAQVRRIFPP